jgi:hypothetical protein
MAPIKAKAYEARMFPMRAYTASRRTTGVSAAKTMVTVRRTRKKTVISQQRASCTARAS